MKLKYISQAFLYLVEVVVVTSILVYISQKIKICSNHYEIFERYTAVFVIYQGLVFLFNSNFLDAKKDIYLAYKTYLKRCLLYLEYEDHNLLDELKSKKDNINDPMIFMDKDYKNKFNEIYDMLIDSKKEKREKEFKIKLEIIQTEHRIDSEDLKWRFSLLVKLFK